MADELNFQLPESGFDSYLVGIIPEDQAVLAGAFSVAMQQIRNIQSVDIQKFAQVAYNIESMAGLPFVNGTDIPTNLQLATFAKSKTALGAGIYGTYTMSNFFGCMSGLPYPLKAIYDGIKQLETDKLKRIYQQLYWTVTAEQATGTVSITLSAVPQSSPSTDYDYYYQITGLTLTDAGGGYGRGGASAPNVTISGSSGATASCTIDVDPNNVPGTFGRVTSLSLTSAGSLTNYGSGSSSTAPDPGLTLTFQHPPTQALTYPYTTGGSNGSSLNWTTLNSYIVNTLVKDANDEIQSIKTVSEGNFTTATILNTNWDITGTALKQEQRARHNAIPPVSIPYDYWASLYPTSLIVFTDSIPQLALQTEPHMTAQTLEHISNMKNTGGQSVVGLMRQERNQVRLNEIGIELDNNLPSALSDQQEKMLLSNGTLPGAVEGIPSCNGSGTDYTTPSNPAAEIAVDGNPCNGDVITREESPKPVAMFDTNIQALRQVSAVAEPSIAPIIENCILGPNGNGTGPVILVEGRLPPGAPPPTDPCGLDPPPELVFTPNADNNNQVPNILIRVPIGETPILNVGSGLFVPDSTLPPNLDTNYTGSVLLPSTYDVNDAIDKVIECNCDCWVD